MARADEKRIEDIRQAGRQLAEIVEKGQQAYYADRVSQLATERLLKIMGEAATAMSDGARASFPDVDWRGLMRLRTLLAHHYHRAQADQLWTAAMEDVPRLIAALSTGEG